jgi:hypothetical protein
MKYRVSNCSVEIMETLEVREGLGNIRAPSSWPSPPVGEKVAAGRLRGKTAFSNLFFTAVSNFKLISAFSFQHSAFQLFHRSLFLLSLLSTSSFASETPPGIAAPSLPVVIISARPVTASKQATAAKAARPPVLPCSRRRAVLPAVSNTRLQTLSQIESGDNDLAIGASSEVSRYQISPSVWPKYFLKPAGGSQQSAAGQKSVVSSQQSVATNYHLLTTDLIRASASIPMTAHNIAAAIMTDRTMRFAAVYNRQPTDFEWYILWSRPACLLAPNSHLPSASVRSRAQRFANLCNCIKSMMTGNNIN